MPLAERIYNRANGSFISSLHCLPYWRTQWGNSRLYFYYLSFPSHPRSSGWSWHSGLGTQPGDPEPWPSLTQQACATATAVDPYPPMPASVKGVGSLGGSVWLRQRRPHNGFHSERETIIALYQLICGDRVPPPPTPPGTSSEALAQTATSHGCQRSREISHARVGGHLCVRAEVYLFNLSSLLLLSHTHTHTHTLTHTHKEKTHAKKDVQLKMNA